MARLVRLTLTDPLKIDPKTLPQDKILSICQCGLSQNYPFCDGSHKAARAEQPGTLSIYDKVALDRFFAGRFDDDDLQVFGRFVSYVERSLDHALSHRENLQHRNFDEETGLPNAAYLGQRLHEEIARAAGRENALVLCVCRLENRAELASESGPGHVGRVIAVLAEALRGKLREFDVLARIDSDEFAVLMPEPGRMPGERIFELARAVADVVAKHESLNQPVRVGLAFGYGVHPGDGNERETLLAHARAPRIRMV